METEPQLKTNNTPCEKFDRQLSWWRVLQVLLALAIFILSAYLAGYIGYHALGLSVSFASTPILSGLTFVSTLLTSWCMWYLGGYYIRGWVVTSIILDFFCTGLQIATVAALGESGLPWNCKGLTSSFFSANDAPNDPLPGYTTVRFGNGTTGSRGMLDHYCPIPMACFWQSIGLLVFYTWTFVLSIRLGVALSRKRNADKDLASKYVELDEISRPVPPPGPLQEMTGVLSQATELPLPLSTTFESPQPEARHDLEATISNGSWGPGSVGREHNNPPPYEPPSSQGIK